MKTGKKVAKGAPIQASPALTPEGREARCIGYAMDLVERRLLDGSASSQETVFFLKLGMRERQLELEKLQNENALLQVKAEQIRSGEERKELYAEAIGAMLRYRASSDDNA